MVISKESPDRVLQGTQEETELAALAHLWNSSKAQGCLKLIRCCDAENNNIGKRSRQQREVRAAPLRKGNSLVLLPKFSASVIYDVVDLHLDSMIIWRQVRYIGDMALSITFA